MGVIDEETQLAIAEFIAQSWWYEREADVQETVEALRPDDSKR